MDSVGLRIKRLRKDTGMTQYDLAKFVRCSSQVISNIERGYTKPSPDLLARIASYFNVSADYLFGKTESRWDADNPYSRTNLPVIRMNQRMQLLHIDKQELAEASAISIEECHNILSGRTKPAVDTLSSIASTLQTTTDYLIGKSEYAIAVSNEDEEDVLTYFRNMNKSQKRRFMGLLEDMMNS